jgi:allantoinase
MISFNSWPKTMPDLDLILRNGNLVTTTGVTKTDIGIAEGKIVALRPSISASTREEINATDLHIFPGVIDAHVHFNEPGRTDWEGIETGSRALAAGGGTMFFDMPLNAHPPTCDPESFDLKFTAAKKNSLTDFALWGGLVPQNLDQLERLAERGVIGFKAFMSNSGIEDFSRADHSTLHRGMKRVAQTGLLVAVHAESESLTQKLSQERISQHKTSIRDYLDSRPIEAELEAIRAAIDMAGDTRCPLHIVHVSSAEGVGLVTEAKKRGADVTCETCPHYLVLTNWDVEKLGAVAKCAPPLRSGDEQEMLWQRVLDGEVTTIGSDHSPSPPDMKRDSNFFKVWGGISGVQHTLQLLLTRWSAGLRPGEFEEIVSDTDAPDRRSALQTIARLTSLNVAERFRLPKTKGQVGIGAEANFSLVDLNQSITVAKEDLLYRHQQSPYVGRKLCGKVLRTILRGRTIFQDGKVVAKPSGNLVKPVL